MQRLAAALRAAGIAPGDRIAVLDLNHPSAIELTLACAQIGAANAVVNFRLAPPEIVYVIKDSRARLLFVGPEFAAAVDEFRDELDGRRAGDPRRRRTTTSTRRGWPRTSPIPMHHPRRAGRLLRAALHVGHDGLPEGRDAHPPRHARALANVRPPTLVDGAATSCRWRCRCSTSAA